MALTIKRARRVVDLVTDLALHEEYIAALRALDAASAGEPLVAMEVGKSAATKAAAQHVQDLEAQMAATTLRFTLEAVTRKRWAEHVAEHPPREGDEADRITGMDLSSVDPLIAESIIAVHDADGQPIDFDPATEWLPLADEMSDGQWGDFADAIVNVNRGTAAPKSKAASLVMRASERTSKQPSA